VCAVLVTAGCSRDSSGPGASPSLEPALVFTLEDAGETATLGVGQMIIVDLEPVDGQPWSLFDYPETILRPLVGQDGAPGRGFVAVAEGRGTAAGSPALARVKRAPASS
jgi:hypothetical protein